MLKYFKNFILVGEIDFFCLLCKESFEVVDQVEKHIRWEQHRKLIKSQEYLPKLKKDGVYKVSLLDNYYCEICNYVTPSFNTIKNHVMEDIHKIKKSNTECVKEESLVKRDSDFVIVSKILMNKKEWHGVINNNCLLCNTSVKNFTAHIILPSHMITLIQSKIIIEQDDQVYRKINEDTFYCFKCRNTVCHKLLADHLTSEEHVNKINEENSKVKHLFNVDKETGTAACVVCKATVIWSYFPICRHREKHIVKGEWTKDINEIEQTVLQLCFQDKGKLRSELKKYGKDNFIKMNERGSKGFCTLCCTFISAHIYNFRQHVDGIRHTNFLEVKGLIKKTKKTEKLRYKTKPFGDLIKQIVHIKSSSTFVIPHLQLCIDMLSMAMVTYYDYKAMSIVCYLCGGIHPDVSDHITQEHKEILYKTEVITTLKGEFIREIQPGLYHCGVCNQSYAGWSVLEKHFKLVKHRFAQMEANKKLKNLVDPNIFDCAGNCSNTQDFFALD